MNLRQTGFTLIEIAIALIIVAILLGYAVAMLPLQQELKQYRSVEKEMDLIVEELIAFAQVNGRLPCPDTSGDIYGTGAGSVNGLEDREGDFDCKAFFGFLPARTLGMNGDYLPDGTLVDPWGLGYRYAISDADVGNDGAIDLVTANNVRDEGIENVAPNLDLVLCDDSTIVDFQTTCAAAGGSDVIDGVAVVIISLGREHEIPAASVIQGENLDDFHDGTNDKVYIKSARRDDYDDVVRWISPNLLFSRMIQADQLP